MCKNLYTVDPQGNAVNVPDIPNVGSYVNPLYLYVITGSGHKHTLIGGHAVRDANLELQTEGDHTHIVIRLAAGQWIQRIMPESYDTGDGGHQHDLELVNGEISPDWYILFWKGTDAEADQILAHSGVNWLVDAEITTEQVGNPPQEVTTIGELINVQWTQEEQDQKIAQFLSVLGLNLHSDIDSGKRLIQYFCGTFLATAGQQEISLRYTRF